MSNYSGRASRYEVPMLLTGAWRLGAFIPCFVQPMAAQEYRATVAGVETDPTHAVVPGAKVTLRDINTNVERVVQTDSSGFYRFDFVIPGTHNAIVEAAGFQKYEQENVNLQLTCYSPVLGCSPTSSITEVSYAQT